MLIAVGSTNNVKIEATKRAFSKFYENISVIGVNVDSGVPSQPINEQAFQGALNRANNALKLVKDADFGVGIEGCVMKIFDKYYCTGFVVIISKSGEMHTGFSGWFECPPKLLPRLLAGEELGLLMDEVSGRKNIKYNEGAIGILTRGVVSRTDLYEHGIIMALTGFLTKL